MNESYKIVYVEQWNNSATGNSATELYALIITAFSSAADIL
jgi:hypothetical protein